MHFSESKPQNNATHWDCNVTFNQVGICTCRGKKQILFISLIYIISSSLLSNYVLVRISYNISQYCINAYFLMYSSGPRSLNWHHKQTPVHLAIKTLKRYSSPRFRSGFSSSPFSYTSAIKKHAWLSFSLQQINNGYHLFSE